MDFLNLDVYYYKELLDATLETIYLSVVSIFFVGLFGLIIGIALFGTSKNQIFANKYIYNTLSVSVSIVRSIPFVILVVLLLPFTKFTVGSIIGLNSALPPLIIGISPFYAKMVETSFKEVNKGLIETAQAYGASNCDIIRKVLIRESLPNLISNLTTLSISIIGYTALSGLVGAGGLGYLAYVEGFQRNNQIITIYSTIIILILVLIIQLLGDYFAKKFDKK